MPTPRQRTALYIIAAGIIALLVYLRHETPKRTIAKIPQAGSVEPDRRAPPPRATLRARSTPAKTIRKSRDLDNQPEKHAVTPTPDRRTKVMVHVVEHDGTPVDRAPVTSPDCDLYTIARGGRAVIYLDPDDVCTLRGGRRDGVLVAWSEAVMVEGGVSDDEVYLEVPSEKTAGLGISIAEHEDGVLVRYVFNGSPAAEAGMRPGDVIVELEGRNTAQMLLDDFIAEATGPVGTTVEVVIARGDDESGWEEVTMTVERQEVRRQRG